MLPLLTITIIIGASMVLSAAIVGAILVIQIHEGE
jgi:hypothetical protein